MLGSQGLVQYSHQVLDSILFLKTWLWPQDPKWKLLLVLSCPPSNQLGKGKRKEGVTLCPSKHTSREVAHTISIFLYWPKFGHVAAQTYKKCWEVQFWFPMALTFRGPITDKEGKTGHGYWRITSNSPVSDYYMGGGGGHCEVYKMLGNWVVQVQSQAVEIHRRLLVVKRKTMKRKSKNWGKALEICDY